MQTVVIDIPDNKLSFFMELFNTLGLKNVEKLSSSQKEFVSDLKQSLNEAEQHENGEIKLQTARDFLNEL